MLSHNVGVCELKRKLKIKEDQIVFSLSSNRLQDQKPSTESSIFITRYSVSLKSAVEIGREGPGGL